ncbi:MAG: hypothetical protein WBQ48_08155, partial [Aeromicrobium sp.]
MTQPHRGTATIEFIWLSILLLVPLLYVLVAVFDAQRAAYGTSSASRAAARAFLQSPDVVTGERRARSAARLAMTDQGVDGATVQISCLPTSAACLQPGSSVRVFVQTSQRLPLTPS